MNIMNIPLPNERRRVLIVGLGIAGMSAAISLSNAGWIPTIIERTAMRRTGGYFVGLFPEGLQAATRLGVMDYIHLRTPKPSVTWEVNLDGSRRLSPGFFDQPGNPQGVLRGDIEAGLWQAIDGRMDVRFATTPTEIMTEGDSIRVRMEHLPSGEEIEEHFDLVIGADGLRSTVRRLVFGPHEHFMKPLNAMICAFQLNEQVPPFTNRDSVILSRPGRALWIFGFKDRPPTALFTYRTRDIDRQFKHTPGETLREVYQDLSANGIIEHAFDQLAAASDFLFDSVHQVKMPTWHQGRILLLGDAAWCLTLYSGMGATSGMRGGAVLGDMLQRHPRDIETALTAWEQEMRSFIRKQERLVPLKSQFFVPSNRFAAWMRWLFVTLSARRQYGKRTLGVAQDADQVGEVETGAPTR